jgi:hypothetical protein
MSRTRSWARCGRGRVARDQPRLQQNRGGAPAVEPFGDRRDRTVGLLAGLWADRGQVDVAGLRKQAVVKPLIETSLGTSTPAHGTILMAVRRRAVDEAASQLHTHRQQALTVLT